MFGQPADGAEPSRRWAALACVIVASFASTIAYPFLPGPSDSMARGLSMAVQLGALVGLLMSPLGLIWWVARRRSRHAGRSSDRRFALVGLGLGTVAVGSAALALAGEVGISASLALIGWVWLAKAHRPRRPVSNRVPIALTLGPAALLAFQVGAAGPLGDLALDRGTAAAEPLIASIEDYRTEHGHYPETLESLYDDTATGVIGVDRFRYAKWGDSYTLYFELPAMLIEDPGARRVAAYGSGEPRVMSHDSWILFFDPEELGARQGWFDAIDSGHLGWRIFSFD